MAEHTLNSKAVILPQPVTHVLKAVIELRQRGGQVGFWVPSITTHCRHMMFELTGVITAIKAPAD